MDIENLTIGEAKKIAAMFCGEIGVKAATNNTTQCPWEIGKVYLIRTVTMIDTGRLVQVTDRELVLEDAAWIADTGRFSDALAKTEFNEVEPFPEGRVIVGRGSVIDAVEIARTQRRQR